MSVRDRDRDRDRERESMCYRKGGQHREKVEVQIINKWLKDRFEGIAESVKKRRWPEIQSIFAS